ncbi:hypothetical protein TrRE_jg11901, partial [Triparma retinervis]
IREIYGGGGKVKGKRNLINRYDGGEGRLKWKEGLDRADALGELRVRFTEVTAGRGHEELAGSDEWWEYLALYNAVMDAVTLPPPGSGELKAFLIELYNLSIKVSFVVNGVPRTTVDRLGYFDACRVRVGVGEDGMRKNISFNGIENGLLRGNRVPPYHLNAALAPSSPFLPYSLPCDYRVHSALNCGARSCPPVGQYTSSGVSPELDVAWSSWVRGEGGARRKEGGWEVSMIMKWYGEDFGDGGTTMEDKVGEGRGEKVEGKVGFMEYDWGTGEGRTTWKGGLWRTIKGVVK